MISGALARHASNLNSTTSPHGTLRSMVPIRVILGLYWGYMGDNGKENGNYYSILGLYLGGCQNYGPFFGYPKY